MLDVPANLFELCGLSDYRMHELLILLGLEYILLLLLKLKIKNLDIILQLFNLFLLVSSYFPFQSGSFINLLVFSHLILNGLVQIRNLSLQISDFVRVLLQLVLNLRHNLPGFYINDSPF